MQPILLVRMTDGALLLDKPAGPTSHDLVRDVRRGVAPGTKVGHAGTLDPFATGLLVVLLGRGTRAQRFLQGLPKSYEVVARLGWSSSTGDPEGELTQTGRLPESLDALPVGELRQRPPAYSAVKVAGQRAYRRARAGETFELEPRTVLVTRFELLAREGELATFAIDCSSGTYVRALIAELGDAYCVELRRTAIGPFSVRSADPDAVVDLATLLGAVMPTRRISTAEAALISHGRSIEGAADGELLLVDDHGAVAIAAERDAGRLRTVVGFRP